MKTLLTILLLAICSGCVSIRAELPDGTSIRYASLAKDVTIQPDGVISVTSPKSPDIITAIGAGIAGFFIGK